jgi:hypothetical protein
LVARTASRECLIWEKRDNQAKDTAEKYCTYLRLARKDPDPLIGLIAEDLNMQKTIYLKGYINVKHDYGHALV